MYTPQGTTPHFMESTRRTGKQENHLRNNVVMIEHRQRPTVAPPPAVHTPLSFKEKKGDTKQPKKNRFFFRKGEGLRSNEEGSWK